MIKKLVFLLFALLFLSSCSLKDNSKVYCDQMFALDTVIDITLYSDSDKALFAAESAEKEIQRLENLLSVSKNGDISKLNSMSTEKIKVSSETAYLINKSRKFSAETGGSFDISVYPLMELWGFTDSHYRVPQKSEIEEILRFVDYESIQVEDDTVSLKPGMKIDLGGIAKGYITQKAAEKIRECGIESGIINSGGNVYAFGKKSDGSAFSVGIRDPFDAGSYFAVIELSDSFAVTSGTYQRYFEEGGKRYHHIMDPKTGYPALSDISSVTVTGSDGAFCDAMSTALFVMGIDKAVDLYKNRGDFDFVILDSDQDEVYISKGVSGSLKIAQGYDIKVTVI